jgi:ParB family chromosome partitioning protein
VTGLEQQVEADGGAVLGAYRDPFGGRWVVLAALPIERVEPTPYQRELSKTHVDRLASVIPKVGRFLDPVIAVRHDGAYWTPNGMHRLAAMQKLGAKSMVALVVPDPEVAYRILALNTEKAHNLKDKSLEVVRMAKGLADLPVAAARPESDYAFELEEPAYVTLGLCYEERPRLAGGAYLPVLKRCEAFSSEPIADALREREAKKTKVLALDDAVNGAVERLKAAGLKSAYLKPFVVARVNPLRFVRAEKPGQKAPAADFDKTLDKMIASACKLDASRIRPQDLAGASGPPPEE